MIRTLIAACAATLMLAATPAYAGDPINVCAKKDGALRLSAGASCKANERLMRFAEWEPDGVKPAATDQTFDDRGGLQRAELAIYRQTPHRQSLERFVAQRTAPRKVDSQAQTDNARINALEAKVAALDSRMTDREGLTVILNSMGRDIQTLTKRVDTVEAAKEAPPPTTLPPAPLPPPLPSVMVGRVRAPFEVVGSMGQVILRVSEKENSETGNGAHVSIGPGDGGNYALRVYKGGAGFAAGIGELLQGGGAVVTYDATGAIAASMNAGQHQIALWDNSSIVAAMGIDTRKTGYIAVFKGATPIAFLSQSDQGPGGSVTTRFADGSPMFSADIARGGGSVCVNRMTKGGTIRGDCLGQGLPTIGVGR